MRQRKWKEGGEKGEKSIGEGKEGRKGREEWRERKGKKEGKRGEEFASFTLGGSMPLGYIMQTTSNNERRVFLQNVTALYFE